MKSRDFLLAIIVTVIWGWNFSIIKLGLDTLDPFMLAGFRFLFCAFPIIFFVTKPNVSFRAIAGYGTLFGTGVWGMVNLGVYLGVSAGIASLLLQFSAFFTLILGFAFLKERISLSQLLGFSLSLAGLVCILTLADGNISVAGVAFILLGAFCWSLTNIIIKKTQPDNVFSFLVWSCLFAAFPLFALGYLVNGAEAFANIDQALTGMAIFSIFFQIYPATLFSFWIWSSLMKKYPVSTVAPLSLLVPIFGLVGSVIIFDEQINMGKILAFSLILSGLMIGLFGKKLWQFLSNLGKKPATQT